MMVEPKLNEGGRENTTRKNTTRKNTTRKNTTRKSLKYKFALAADLQNLVLLGGKDCRSGGRPSGPVLRKPFAQASGLQK